MDGDEWVRRCYLWVWMNMAGLMQFPSTNCLSLYYDTKIAGYAGHWKTLELVSQSY